ncbi:ABC transporter substrate-binding protein [Cryobacterium mannosilyticum]|uniref:ABC transporter substrate-binding protein n=1 Tax=Cryobacterium mannosilyticum TaxID=1259190 RepID=A0A4R8WE99_9MICO|nr:ABC transporter substrate-binding protein [Cryobacterium mannosilyticum]TFC07586.1 ABC transporter substrate-binding protein [Cryobacterium mannosilyticum]
MKIDKRTGRSVLLAASIGVTAALVLAACSASGTSPAPQAPSTADVDAAAAAALPAKYKDAGTIKVASDIPFPPMEMFDDNQVLTGFDYDLAQAIGARLGVTMELQTQAFDSIIPSLQSGKHDVIMSGMNDTPERQKTIDFVDYFHAGFSILVPAGNPGKIATVLDLCGKDVAVQKATVQAEILRGYDAECTAAGSGPMKIAELPLETDVQTAVRSGKAIADVVDSAVASYAAQTAGGGKLFEVVRDPANPAGYNPVYTGIGVLKKDSGLSQALLLALQAVVADGSYAEILKKYDMGDYAVDAAGLNLGS